MGKPKKMPVAVQKKIRAGLQRGELTKHGYSMSDSQDSRRRALRKAVAEDGAATVYRRLLLLRLWNKKRNPKLASIADFDALWVARTYGVQTDGFRFTKG